MAKDLTRPRGPSVEESAGNITKAFDLIGQRERIRQDRQRVSDFISETIRLTAANSDMDPDQIAQIAARNITEKDPEFDPGILGGLQRFAGGLDPGPSTALTGPIAEGLLSQPTGLRKDLIKSQIESNLGLAAARRGTKVREPGTFSPDEKTRNSLVKTIADINAFQEKDPANAGKREIEKQEAIRKIQELPKEVLRSLQDADDERIDTTFSEIMGKLSKLRINTPGNIFNQMFGEKAFNEGLKKAKQATLEEGADPEGVQAIFEKWWDFKAEASGLKREFQPRSEFQKQQPATAGGITEPTTQEEFDAIPTGAQFKDSDGEIKVKK